MISKLNLFTLTLLSIYSTTRARSVRDFYADRAQVLGAEEAKYIGGSIQLTNEEQLANDLLMFVKIKELDLAFLNDDHPSSRSFFLSRPDIEASKVFETLRFMPKGGGLHLHDFAITSIDWVVSNITYRDNLYACTSTPSLKFGWYNSQPGAGVGGCDVWESAKSMRESLGSAVVDERFKKSLSIVVDNPEVVYPNVNAVWAAFAQRFGALFSLLGYAPIVKDYFYQGLQEFYDDGVQYVEVRTVVPDVCANLDNNNCQPLGEIESARVFKDAADQFAVDHPSDWCGVKLIYGPSRKVEPEAVTKYITTAVSLTAEFPNFFVGFDMVGQEDLGRPLIDFAPEIIAGLEQNPNLKVFFHAAETIWQGQSTDLNVIDALLFNAKRIGHGYAITKHPEAKRLALEKNTPIEVNPISNQVLGLVKDLRNHPVASLIAEGFPIVVSSDDPGLWDAKGLSYDYYSVFMAMAGKTMDLKLLKQLVQNSLDYSNLEGDELVQCQSIVDSKWKDFIQSFQPRIIV